ncbi:hypothetical protein [Fructobacillus durionis]|uniref:Bacteriophage holin of superfamily 6 (Holin_LLH) n=1 Tax=Fructobacillus durionis TaxID=283737 RepID=A0A1I1HWL0_9LACO|nr:hypothetical protein [Fructobacillus durionis]SFC25360.1 Bacteriophage holin of superfamily 6 (Holin_LLH) [Fructobacillus durionis]
MVQDILVALATALSGTIIGLIVYSIKYIKAHTRNQHIKTACDWAEQAVAFIANAGVVTDSSKVKAVNTLAERIHANGLGKNFDEQQIEAYINQAISQLNFQVEQQTTQVQTEQEI